MVKKLTNIVKENWENIVLTVEIASTILGGYIGYSGIIKADTKNIIIGGSILTASYIGAAVLNQFSNYKPKKYKK